MAVDLKMDPRVFLDEDPVVQTVVEEMVAIRGEQIRAEKEEHARQELRKNL